MLKVILWNKEEDAKCRFVVENEKNEYTEYSVSNPKDVIWTKEDISKEDEYSDWMPFNGEEVESLDYLMM